MFSPSVLFGTCLLSMKVRWQEPVHPLLWHLARRWHARCQGVGGCITGHKGSVTMSPAPARHFVVFTLLTYGLGLHITILTSQVGH